MLKRMNSQGWMDLKHKVDALEIQRALSRSHTPPPGHPTVPVRLNQNTLPLGPG